MNDINIPEDLFQQHIPLEGTPNFRDLGGRLNVNGQEVRRGKLFRSGFLSELNDNDWDIFKSLNISTICDFRRYDELERNPTSPPFEVNITHLPIGDGSHHELIKKAFSTQDVVVEKVVDFMRDINKDFVFEHAHTYQRYFEELLALGEDEAMLFHCSAGKDRTGFAAALTLLALGVERQSVLDDYMLSMRFFRPEREMQRIIAMLPGDRLNDLNPDILMPILTTDIEYIKSAFDMIDQAGGFEQYAKDYLALNQTAVHELKQRLLDE